MRPIALGPCSDTRHDGHDVVVRSYPVGPQGHPRGLLTLWRCPVEGWGGFWHDLGHDPMGHPPIGGPLP